MKLPIKKYLKILLVLTVFLALLGVTGQVFAALGEYTPLVKLPGIDKAEANNLPEYLKAMFKLLLGVAGALAVIMITLGGIEYMSTDSMFGKEEGKKKINNALLGLLLAIGAWLILFTVNPKLLEFNFNPAPIAPINPPPRWVPPPLSIGEIHKNRYCFGSDGNNQGNFGLKLPPIEIYYYLASSSISIREKIYECKWTSPVEGVISPTTTACPDGTKTELIRCDDVGLIPPS
ncbi:MAG: hypothetical protein AAB635_00700 [Patescibacteria group bacterium]